MLRRSGQPNHRPRRREQAPRRRKPVRARPHRPARVRRRAQRRTGRRRARAVPLVRRRGGRARRRGGLRQRGKRDGGDRRAPEGARRRASSVKRQSEREARRQRDAPRRAVVANAPDAGRDRGRTWPRPTEGLRLCRWRRRRGAIVVSTGVRPRIRRAAANSAWVIARVRERRYNCVTGFSDGRAGVVDPQDFVMSSQSRNRSSNVGDAPDCDCEGRR